MKHIHLLITFIYFFQITAAAQSRISDVDFDNFTYQTECFGGNLREFKVKKGLYFRSTIMADDNNYTSVKVIEKRFLDVNADEKKDAVILLSCDTNGKAELIEGFVYTLRKNKPVLLSRFEGDFASFEKLKTIEVKNNILVFTFSYRDFNRIDSSNQNFQFLYKWNRGKLKLLGTKRTSP